MAEHQQQSQMDCNAGKSEVEENQNSGNKPDHSEQSGQPVSESPQLPYIEKTFENEEDWLQWRIAHIGASESPALMGESPFQSRFELMRAKLNPNYRQKSSPMMERGKQLEDPVRRLLELRLKEPLPEKVCQSLEHPSLVAQIDGLGEHYQVEIKCPYRQETALKMAQEIPRHYQIQMQHQMLVTGREIVQFAVYFEGVLSVSLCKRDPVLQHKILESCEQFLADLKQAHQASEKQSKNPLPS